MGGDSAFGDLRLYLRALGAGWRPSVQDGFAMAVGWQVLPYGLSLGRGISMAALALLVPSVGSAGLCRVGVCRHCFLSRANCALRTRSGHWH